MSFCYLRSSKLAVHLQSLVLQIQPVRVLFLESHPNLSYKKAKLNLKFHINMSTISSFQFMNFNVSLSAIPSNSSEFPIFHSTHFSKYSSCSHILSIPSRKSISPIFCRSTEAEELSSPEDEWLQKLPDKKKPLYSHSLPCIEAWLRSLGFSQSKDDRAVWLIQKPDWHAQLSLDVTDLFIRYLKSGPGNLEKDVERRFSYALSREDIENAVLGGP